MCKNWTIWNWFKKIDWDITFNEAIGRKQERQFSLFSFWVLCRWQYVSGPDLLSLMEFTHEPSLVGLTYRDDVSQTTTTISWCFSFALVKIDVYILFVRVFFTLLHMWVYHMWARNRKENRFCFSFWVSCLAKSCFQTITVEPYRTNSQFSTGGSIFIKMMHHKQERQLIFLHILLLCFGKSFSPCFIQTLFQWIFRRVGNA